MRLALNARRQDALPRFDIFTITIGREHYLPAQLDHLQRARRQFGRHLLVANGCELSRGLRRRLRRLGSEIITTERTTAGGCIERLKPLLGASHAMKLDDDAIPIGDDFFAHMRSLVGLLPDHVLSPYPVGLVKNPGGPRLAEGEAHRVVFAPGTDTYYTLRPVRHMGGLARVAPRACYDLLRFSSTQQTDDADFARALRAAGVPMCYVENGAVVEHAETVWGQRQRDPAYWQDKQQGLRALGTAEPPASG
jgi:hypothetical protein